MSAPTDAEGRLRVLCDEGGTVRAADVQTDLRAVLALLHEKDLLIAGAAYTEQIREQELLEVYERAEAAERALAESRTRVERFTSGTLLGAFGMQQQDRIRDLTKALAEQDAALEALEAKLRIAAQQWPPEQFDGEASAQCADAIAALRRPHERTEAMEQALGEMHWKGGWMFKRLDDGTVRIRLAGTFTLLIQPAE